MGRRRSSATRALAAVVLAAVLLGTTGTASTLGADGLDPAGAAAWRTVIGGVGLVAAAARWARAPWRYPLVSRWTVVGGIGVAVNQLAFFEGVERTGVAVGTLVTIAAVPVTAGVLDAVTARAPGRWWVAGVAIAVTGVGLLGGSGAQVDVGGVAVAAVSGAAGATFGFAAQRLLRDRPVLPAMATVVAGGAVLLLPVAVAHAAAALGTPQATVTVAYLGFVTLTAAYALWGAGLSHLTLGAVTAVGLLEPAVAAVLATTVLDEPATPALAAGVGLVLVGVAVASRRRR